MSLISLYTSMMGIYSPWGVKELDTTKQLNNNSNDNNKSKNVVYIKV